MWILRLIGGCFEEKKSEKRERTNGDVNGMRRQMVK